MPSSSTTAEVTVLTAEVRVLMNATGDTEADRLARVAAYREALAAGEALTEALAALEAQK